MRREEERGDHTKRNIERSESNTRLNRSHKMKLRIPHERVNEEDEESIDIQVD